MDDLVTWLRGVLDEIERTARDCIPTRSPDEGVWNRAADSEGLRIEGEHFTIYDEGGHDEDQAAHIALHDPRAVLARVEAERAIVDAYERFAADEAVDAIRSSLPAPVAASPFASIAGEFGTACAREALRPTVKALAYGHRHDAAGWREEWAPESVR